MESALISNDDQRMLRDSVRRWAEQFDPRVAAPAGPVFEQIQDMGWLLANLPESMGGLGGTILDCAIIAEEMGRALVRAAYVEAAVTAAQLLAALAPERASSMAAGRLRPILAHEELAARGEPTWVGARALGSGNVWRLHGHKTAILGAPQADTLIVSAWVEEAGITAFELSAKSAPLAMFTTIDDRPCGELRLNGTPATLLGPPGGAMPAIAAALDHALVVESSEAVGAMQRALELTRDYLLARRQYGQPLSEFQALRHRLADMFIELEQARSMVIRGLESLTCADPVARSRMAAATKARVSQAGMFITAQAIQLHGGMGVTNEFFVGHYFKRLLAFNQRRGAAEVHVERFAALDRERQPSDASAAAERNQTRE